MIKHAAVIAVLSAIAAGQALAQASFPARPVRMVVAFTAGSETDFLARIVSQRLTERWGQQIVVDNRPGAGGMLAAGIVVNAAGDGHTLFVNSMAHAITPAIYTRMPYNTLRDFASISQIAGVPNVLVVAPNSPLKSVKSLIATAKEKSGGISYGSAGIGSGMHINGEQFRLAAGINVLHIPYRGGPEAVRDLVGGRIDYVFSPIGLALPLIRDKRVLPVAVSTAGRSPALPDVPTVAESGVPAFDFDTWYGLFTSGSTPPPMIDRLFGEVSAALKHREAREKLLARGAVPKSSGSPAEFDSFVRAEVAKLAQVVKAAGIPQQ